MPKSMVWRTTLSENCSATKTAGVRLGLNLLTIPMTVACVLATACRQDSAEKQVVAEPVAVQSNAAPSPTPEPDVSVKNFISDFEPLEKERVAGLRRAWARVPRNNDFRVARSDDFGEPRRVFDYGEIAGAYGIALMVIDKTKPVDSRFGLIIFLERPGDRYDTYWIYRDVNLRSFSMQRASGDIFVEEKFGDGSRKLCEIQWTRKKGQWTCEPL